MTPSAYLWRKVKRLEQWPVAVFDRSDVNGWLRFVGLAPNVQVSQAYADLAKHVDAKVRPSVTDTVWRSKRDGGPYRLDFGT